MTRTHRARRAAAIPFAVCAIVATLLVAVPANAAKPPKDADPEPTAATSFVAVEKAAGFLDSGTSLAVPVPAEATEGDLLLAHIGYNAAGTITPAAGWNVIDVTTHGSKPVMQGLYWRAASADEPASYSFGLASGKADTVAGAISAYRGIDLSDPVDAVASAGSTGTSLTAPSVTTSVDGATLIALYTVRDDGSATPPAGMIERWDLNSSAGVGAIGETLLAAADALVATAGATGDHVANVSRSDGHVATLLALTPSEPVFIDPIAGGDAAIWEDGSALEGVPQGQYGGSMEWVTNQITGANAFWNAGYTGAGVDIALIDSGVVPVDGLLMPGKVVNGPDLSFESQAWYLRYLDTFGHGTHLAGIIAGRDLAGTKFSGMAPGATLLNIKVADAQGAVDVSQVIAALDWVVEHRYDRGMDVRVINLAYGTDGVQPYQIDPLSHAVERAWRAGIVVVVAAGNDGNDSPLRNPAIDPYVIAVGASENASSHITGVAPFSNCGNGDRFTDIVAPGRSILSLRNPGSYLDQHYPGAAVNGSYFLGSGTSQAAAVVTGGIALLLEQRPSLTPDQVKALLMDNAKPINGASSICQGAGALDLRAVEKARTPSRKSSTQSFELADGTGSLEAARGTNHVADNGVVLDGEIDIMGNAWSGYCSLDGTSTCLDTLWDGSSFNGSEWTGLSWSGLSWSGLSWSGLSWSGLSWSGLSWSSKEWQTGYWNGLSWSGLSWSGLSWSGLSWSGDTWSGLSWK